MKRVVGIIVALLLITSLFTVATAEVDGNYCHHECHHECGYCHVDLLNQAPDALNGREVALIARMYTRPYVDENNAKFLGICLKDADVFFEPNGEKIGVIYEKDEVFVISVGKYWYKIVYADEFIGYVRPAAVEIYDANLPHGGQLYRIDNTGGNRHALLRECPCGDSYVVARLNRGDYVRLVDFYNNRWACVIYDADGCMAYIPTRYLIISHRFD